MRMNCAPVGMLHVTYSASELEKAFGRWAEERCRGGRRSDVSAPFFGAINGWVTEDDELVVDAGLPWSVRSKCAHGCASAPVKAGAEVLLQAAIAVLHPIVEMLFGDGPKRGVVRLSRPSPSLRSS